MKIRKILIFTLVLTMFYSCGRETVPQSTPADTKKSGKEYTFTVGSEQTWYNTGIKLNVGSLISISAEDEKSAMGDPIARRFDPVKIFGHGGLIGKIGEKGLPFKIGTKKDLQGNSINKDDYLYLGRNITVMMPSGTTEAIMDAYQPVTDVTEVENDSQILSYMQPIKVKVKVSSTNSPAPLSPVNDFWLEDDTPTFDWDDMDNAVQYIFEVSEFPDFRSLYMSVNVMNSALNTATLNNTSLYPNPGQQQQQVFVEGVYYWRVRAQLNIGRTLSPEFKWSDRSIVSTFGIEQKTAITPPDIINPLDNQEFLEGEKVLLEFTAPRDGSGLLWKLKIYHSECGKVIDTKELAPETVTFWRVFQEYLSSETINIPPQNYAYYITKGLARGEWLIKVILRDGDDDKGERMVSSEVPFTVGCNR